MKALAREVEDRYQWASDLTEDLQPFLIEERSIYSGKKLAAYMREAYAADIAMEQAKMEEFLKITAPVEEPEPADEFGPEKTFIFEASQMSPHAVGTRRARRACGPQARTQRVCRARTGARSVHAQQPRGHHAVRPAGGRGGAQHRPGHGANGRRRSGLCEPWRRGGWTHHCVRPAG
jgi:hypothetical protein